MSNDQDYTGVLLEDIRDSLKGVSEAVPDLNNKIERVDSRLKAVEKNTDLIPVITVAVTDQSKTLNEHQIRISSLEAA